MLQNKRMSMLYFYSRYYLFFYLRKLSNKYVTWYDKPLYVKKNEPILTRLFFLLKKSNIFNDVKTMMIFVPDVYAICTPSYDLSTQPLLPNNILATGYVNFTLKACFEIPRNLSCRWEYGLSTVQFYSGDGVCSQLNSSDYLIKCSVENKILIHSSSSNRFPISVQVSIIDTSFTLLVPISTTYSSFKLSCKEKNVIGISIGRGFIYRSKTAVVQSKLNICDNADTVMFYVMCLQLKCVLSHTYTVIMGLRWNSTNQICSTLLLRIGIVRLLTSGVDRSQYGEGKQQYLICWSCLFLAQNEVKDLVYRITFWTWLFFNFWAQNAFIPIFHDEIQWFWGFMAYVLSPELSLCSSFCMW